MRIKMVLINDITERTELIMDCDVKSDVDMQSAVIKAIEGAKKCWPYIAYFESKRLTDPTEGIKCP